MTDDVIEGVAVDVTDEQPSRALVPVGRDKEVSSLEAMGALSDDEYAARRGAMTKGIERVQDLQRSMLVKGVDYDVIPGTKVPSLLQPGAEKLAQFYRLIPRSEIATRVYQVEGHADRIEVQTHLYLHHGSTDGPVVGEGVAVASSWEDRYRYRDDQRRCPECGAAAIIKGKEEYGGGWLCFKKKGGCGAKFADSAAVITDQKVGKVENDEPHALIHTLTQISYKRALVSGVKRALAASGLFTMDVEDTRPPSDGGDYGDPGYGAEDSQQGSTRRSAPPRSAGAADHSDDGSGKWQGTVDGMPDGLGKGPGAKDNEVHVKVKVKAGRSTTTHHLYLVDYYAGWASTQAPILSGQQIAYEGHLTEQPWGDGTKPPVKEIRAITKIAVRPDKDAEWKVVESPNGDALQGGIDATMEEPKPEPAPAMQDQGEPSAVEIDGWDDELPTKVEVDPMTLPVYAGEATTIYDGRCWIASREEATVTRTGAKLMRMWLVTGGAGDPHRIESVMPRPEYEAQGVEKRTAEHLCRIVGSWHRSGERTLLVLTAVAD